ncbi:hypothetical protein EGW08_018620, partial [Elysia chlorotica]
MTTKNHIVVIDPDDLFDDIEGEPVDSHLPLVCNNARHQGKIEGSDTCLQCWRMKERMKTVSVALVLCLNVGVDPPDVVKISPCARMECWIDPHTMSPQKALESIGLNLQKQYERWQPRARYRQSLDPTVDEVKKLCTSLRRNAKEERVLFHYIGHGVPKPTANGEIWVFNKTYTQYIPLSLYDLQIWMGSPSIYVFDCSNAGIIIDLFKTFTVQREQEAANAGGLNPEQSVPSSLKNSILLAACGATEHLPMNPDLPADLFTSCLTTPIKVALRWYVLQNRSLVPGLTMEMVDKIPGQLNDRRTMLGELNWIFTAITDTIAWNSLPRELFQKLFRQDLLVASLFRNFLLAERIMRSYNCIPISNPKLPPTHQHPMWHAWDLALDLCLQQLTVKPISENMSFTNSPFFAEQLTAFSVWLDYGSKSRRPPEQLPIVLQVLLSQVHRVRALDLLGKFLDLGPWAVNLALSVGIFPYVLKLLQSTAKELKPLLVFIWAKILAVDPSCQADLVKDSGHKYILNVLSDTSMAAEHRTMAAFVMAIIMNNYAPGREAALKDNTISACLEQLNDPDAHLRQWLILCLAKVVWTNFDNARWCGVRDRAHEKLSKLLSDPEPEVRAATVFALGTFVSRSLDRTDHSVTVDGNVGNLLVKCIMDCSPLVRKELVVAFGGFVSVYLSQFVALAKKLMDEEKERMAIASTSTDNLTNGHAADEVPTHGIRPVTARRISAGTSVGGVVGHTLSGGTSVGGVVGHTFVTVYSSIWLALAELASDPHHDVAGMAQTIVDVVKKKLILSSLPTFALFCVQASMSSHNRQVVQSIVSQTSHSAASSPSRSSNMPFGYNSYVFSQPEDRDEATAPLSDLVSTQFFEWSCRHFSQPTMCLSKEEDPESRTVQVRDFRFMRNSRVRCQGRDQLRTGICVSRLDDQMFVNKVAAVPTAIKFHPYENFLAVADAYNVSFWNSELGTKECDIPNPNAVDKSAFQLFKASRITSVDFMNAHDAALFMFCTDDGAIRIYRDFLKPHQYELVTAFKGLSELVPSEKGSGLVTEWEQESSTLITSGNARIIRLWDMQKEMKISDINTGAESCVTSLASDSMHKSLLIAGCGDGSVRLFDRRLNPSECRVMTLKEHESWILKVHLQRGSEGKIVSACCNGDIRFWDPRFTDSVRRYSAPTTLSSVDIHPRADIIACGSTSQTMTAYSPNGVVLSTVKYHEGFLGQRIGNASCM